MCGTPRVSSALGAPRRGLLGRRAVSARGSVLYLPTRYFKTDTYPRYHWDRWADQGAVDNGQIDGFSWFKCTFTGFAVGSGGRHNEDVLGISLPYQLRLNFLIVNLPSISARRNLSVPRHNFFTIRNYLKINECA